MKPVVPSTKKPTSVPRNGDGKKFAFNSLPFDIGDTDDAGDPATNYTTDDNLIYIPGCADHPVQYSPTFGGSTVNGATTECPNTNALSGVIVNVFDGQGTNPNIYDKFCENRDGTVNSRWFIDAYGNQRDPVPSSGGKALVSCP